MWLVMLPEGACVAGGVEVGVKAAAPVGSVQHRQTVQEAAYAAQQHCWYASSHQACRSFSTIPASLLYGVHAVATTVVGATAAVAKSLVVYCPPPSQMPYVLYYQALQTAC